MWVDRRVRRWGEDAGFRGARWSIGRALAAAFVVLTLCVSTSDVSRAGELDSLTIATASGVHSFQVEIAADDAAREKGLMYRRFMPADRGMLFEFEREAPVAFWMKNTYIPLDMIFIARDGSVTRIAADAQPLSEAIVPSGGPCVAVLELNGGVAARIGLKVGDTVRHPFFKP
ncbi:MAG: DUF192 domain-containing protein [Roseiarcus sp.]